MSAAPEPERAILDTSVLIGSATAVAGWECAISVISVAELRFGVLIAADPLVRAQRLRRLEAVLREFDPLPVDDAVADHYGALAALVKASGRQPRARQFDLLIAATAAAHGATVLTWNTDDITGLDGVVPVRTP